MKKYIKLMVFLLLIVLLLVLFYIKSEHSLKTIVTFLEEGNKISNNIYIKKEITDNRINSKSIEEIYKKDNLIYEHYYKDDIPEYEDILWNFEEGKKISINYVEKKIDIEQLEANAQKNLATDEFIEFLKSTENKYKYYGKEYIEGEEYIKFSLTDENDYITYYYINAENRTLYKSELGKNYDNGFTVFYTTIYTYSYNTVTANDILVFNIEDFPDYEYFNEQ